MDCNLVLLMVGIHALMFLTPGPDSIVVVSRATAQGMGHAFAATLGVVSAGAILVPAIAFGLDIVNDLSPAIWMAVRAAGAVYLIYIGYRMLALPSPRAGATMRAPVTPWHPKRSRSRRLTSRGCSPRLEIRRSSFS